MKERFTVWLDKFSGLAVKFSSISVIQAISKGIMTATPFIMIGSIFVLLGNIPWEPYTEFLANTGLDVLLSIPNTFTMGIISLIVSFSVANVFAKEKGVDGISAGLVAVCSYLILEPIANLEGGGNAISLGSLGSGNLFTAIIVGLVAAWIFSFFVNKGFTIKMPEGVPPETMKAFLALVPAFLTIVIFVILYALFQATPFGSFSALIKTAIQTPLQGLGGTVWAVALFYLLSNAVWFAGIHGNVVMSVVTPILLSLDMANLDAVNAGGVATNIVGLNFTNVYAGMSGAGITIGLALLMVFRAKSQRYKTVGKISVAPGIFCVNEPVIFGTPIMFNVTMIIPFIVLPILSIFLSYFLTSIGILPILSGAQLPWSTPLILLGFLLGGWQVALYQVFLVILSVAIYYPFFKMIDRKAYEEENLVQVEEPKGKIIPQ